jgi:5-methyltetrahydrofolate--homocysteine methyltransferase
LRTDVKELAFEWINHKFLFAQSWGYSGKGMDKESKKLQADELLWPLFDKLKAEILKNDIFRPVILYGYYPCRSDENSLLVFDENEGWFEDLDANREPLDEVMGRVKYHFEFPRQKKAPFRALSDYFQRDRHDVVAFTCVSAGDGFEEYEKKIYEAGDYKKYHLIHGLGVNLAEALAEIVHKQIRLELGIAKNEGNSLRDIKTKAYHGKRYSFGYDACPDLALNKPLFDMLKPQDFGITLSETYQMYPEQTTSALVVHHPEAFYYKV